MEAGGRKAAGGRKGTNCLDEDEGDRTSGHVAISGHTPPASPRPTLARVCVMGCVTGGTESRQGGLTGFGPEFLN